MSAAKKAASWDEQRAVLLEERKVARLAAWSATMKVETWAVEMAVWLVGQRGETWVGYWAAVLAELTAVNLVDLTDDLTAV